MKRENVQSWLGSFYTEQEFVGIGKLPMTFIRAPYIVSVGKGVDVLAREEEHIVAVRYKNQLAMSFHPELDKDNRIHRYFLDMVKAGMPVTDSRSAGC